MIGVLVVEDEPVPAEALAVCVTRTPGFAVVGRARTGVDGLHLLMSEPVDLVLLDIYLPDMNGLEILRRVRGAGNTVDVIAVTRARDAAVVHAAASFGVLHYLVKPFTFHAVRQRLERYQAFRAGQASRPFVIAQPDADGELRLLRGGARPGGPRVAGISRESLHEVVGMLRRCGADAVSAAEVAAALGVSRVTARRYLEYLVEAGLLRRRSRHRPGAGRPELEYAWLPGEGTGLDRADGS